MEGEEGVLILDDYIIKKYGKNMYGVDYHFDHSEGKSVWGLQIADCVLSGKGIYPLLSTCQKRQQMGQKVQNKDRDSDGASHTAP